VMFETAGSSRNLYAYVPPACGLTALASGDEL